MFILLLPSSLHLYISILCVQMIWGMLIIKSFSMACILFLERNYCTCFCFQLSSENPVYSQKQPPSGLQFYYKETPTQAFFCDNCKIFKNTYSEEHLLTAAPVSRFFSANNLVMISKFTAFTKEKLTIRTVSICCKIHRQCIVTWQAPEMKGGPYLLHQLIVVGQENRFAKFKYSGLGRFLAYDLLVFM